MRRLHILRGECVGGNLLRTHSHPDGAKAYVPNRTNIPHFFSAVNPNLMPPSRLAAAAAGESFHATHEYYVLYYCNFPYTKKVWFPSYFLGKAQSPSKVHEKIHTKNSSFFGDSPLDFSVSSKTGGLSTFT